MKKSLQEIEDFYIQKGYKDDELREALKNDADYQEIINNRKSNLRKKFDLPKEVEDRYILSTDHDYEILGACLALEKKEISTGDREMVEFIMSQLELDWRQHLTKKIEKLNKKYHV